MFNNVLVQLVLAASLVSGHILITYPGTRGNSFITNDTFPYGMQWTHPCGGLGLSRNRTYWPVNGGAVAFQPGWFSGHATALLYINIGIDSDGPDGGPMNFTTLSLGVKVGDKATIQIVELAGHGASLFACSDIIFVNPDDERLPPLNNSICFNTTELGFGDLYTITTKPQVVLNSEGVRTSAATGHLDTTSAFRLLSSLVPAVLGGMAFLL
ncbi:unnamed protein product [Parascedosporium putredinis]|uniref:Copper acquisition factor BIM1-like domain-containing protein n=1 Tax=Parascedosporium putredinis TaxID=1442378 RepID=A0A9P1H5Y4_9PEZI|nr:unnamed protein product [Parascedosporium putredinis]CAI7998189.1 unnamed protein product [Parascedosporium putredinis]